MVRTSGSQLRQPHFESSVSKLGQFSVLHIASVHSAVNEYLVTYSGGYVNE